jgi:membrane-associated phospholipid phosphatase
MAKTNLTSQQFKISPSQMGSFFAGFWEACKLDKLPLAIFGIFVICSLGLLASKGINGFNISSVYFNTRLFLTCILFAITISFLWNLIKYRPESPIAFATNFFKEHVSFKVIARHSPVVLSLCIFMPVFSAMKSSISLFASYTWDSTFADWDRYIHFGNAWEILQPVIGFPVITFGFNLAYNFWIVLIYAGTVFFALRMKDPILRQRFLITYFLCWTVLGIVGAILLASVGPIFVGRVLGQREFDPLVSYLYAANEHYPIFALQVQEGLIERFNAQSTALGAGITAMPSMHVSKAFVFFLAMRHVSRPAAVALGIFVLLIMIGSVHLGYHYAVDGYVSLVFTALIWKFAGWLTLRLNVGQVEGLPRS